MDHKYILTIVLFGIAVLLVLAPNMAMHLIAGIVFGVLISMILTSLVLAAIKVKELARFYLER